MRGTGLFVLCLPVLLVQGQYSRFEGITYPEPVQYSQYDQQAEIQDYYDYHDVTPRAPEEQFRYQSQQQSQQETVPAPTPAAAPETEPTEPGPLDCREEQYPCTRLYSVHKPCKQCLNEICFYSLRRVYVINKEICVRTVCAHEELLRGEGSKGWGGIGIQRELYPKGIIPQELSGKIPPAKPSCSSDSSGMGQALLGVLGAGMGMDPRPPQGMGCGFGDGNGDGSPSARG
ncbi:PREDICTED: microfibrillar-associated protein 2 [Lepidothrix coronata]|uniref:Microfibrillar-associated protein 2 n=2 Tax=Passeriformes TaxID=9126 RepID=A0A6J0IS23_9PASS|nr:PREDICTED: microfibrillar-associated protein 2 [Lepidothrix coronata]